MAQHTFGSIVALYRSYVRQIRRLPHLYLRQFFHIKAADDVRAALHSLNKTSLATKVKRVSKDLRKIEAAVSGNVKAFNYILDIAYGRKGKLRWEIMKPILSDPNAQVPPRIILSVEKSRPPVYSPELTALLTNGHSRVPKGLSLKSLASPTTLPSRANPLSEDARLLGPFSRRREVNIRWRYFTQEWKKVLPPLQLVAEVITPEGKRSYVSQQFLLKRGIRGVAMQGHGVFEDIEALPGPPILPRSSNHTGPFNAPLATAIGTPRHTRHPSRWLRRRYQGLLTRLPVLTYTWRTNRNGLVLEKYSVSLSSNAMAPSQFDPSRLPEVITNADIQWLNLAKKSDKGG